MLIAAAWTMKAPSALTGFSTATATAGPMARTVADAAALLNVLAAPDPADPVTVDRRRARVDYTRALAPGGLRGARIGVVRERFFGTSPAADALAEAAIATMRREGAVIVDPVQIDTLASLEILLIVANTP